MHIVIIPFAGWVYRYIQGNISVQGTGMGMPSMRISYELIQNTVKAVESAHAVRIRRCPCARYHLAMELLQQIPDMSINMIFQEATLLRQL